jgi:hypothetical protein
LDRQAEILRAQRQASPWHHGDPRLAVVALATHHLYSCAESIFERVALAFEGMPDQRERWHRSLLDQMGLSIDGIRPAVLSPPTLPPLREMLQFRHFLRHAYAVELDPVRLLDVAQHALDAHRLLSADLDAFDKALLEASRA